MSTFKVPSVPAVPRIPGLPGMRKIPLVTPGKPQQKQSDRDEFGLLNTIYGHAPRTSRQFIAITLEYMGKPKTVTPTALFGVSAGTIPELVVFGFLIDEGYHYRASGPRSFTWLSYELGAGNVEAGTQLDFSVYVSANRRVGVDVDSIFHTAKNPYGAGQKLEQDRRRRQRLLSVGGLSNVMSVNEGRWGHPLEFGPDHLVGQDLQRILFA